MTDVIVIGGGASGMILVVAIKSPPLKIFSLNSLCLSLK